MLPETFLVILGVVLIIEGVPWFLSPQATKRTLTELFRMTDRSLRGIGLFFMLVGLLVIYVARA